MLIVASEIDSSTERIIEYLSSTYGVGINAVTFHYFRNDEGKEFLARVFLIEPGQVEYRTQIKSISKRKPPLTYEELEEIAESNGVGKLYRSLVNGLIPLFDQKTTTRSSIAFIGIMGEKRARNTIFSLLPGESSLEKGLRFTVYTDRFAEYFNVDKNSVTDIMPMYQKEKVYEDWAGEFGGGFFKDEEQVKRFLEKLRKLKHG